MSYVMKRNSNLELEVVHVDNLWRVEEITTGPRERTSEYTGRGASNVVTVWTDGVHIIVKDEVREVAEIVEPNVAMSQISLDMEEIQKIIAIRDLEY